MIVVPQIPKIQGGESLNFKKINHIIKRIEYGAEILSEIELAEQQILSESPVEGFVFQYSWPSGSPQPYPRVRLRFGSQLNNPLVGRGVNNNFLNILNYYPLAGTRTDLFVFNYKNFVAYFQSIYNNFPGFAIDLTLFRPDGPISTDNIDVGYFPLSAILNNGKPLLNTKTYGSNLPMLNNSSSQSNISFTISQTSPTIEGTGQYMATFNNNGPAPGIRPDGKYYFYTQLNSSLLLPGFAGAVNMNVAFPVFLFQNGFLMPTNYKKQ